VNAVLFLDLQEEIVKNCKTISLARLTATAGALAKLAALHDLPAFASAVPPGGSFMSAVSNALPNLRPRDRMQTTAFSDRGLVEALRSCGATRLILAGVASEIVVQRTALDALEAGFEVHLAVDACGGVDPRTEEAALRRVAAAGGVTTSVITFAAELIDDFTTPKGGQTLAICYEAIGAAAL
jgi:hypothetical protein